ncbi:FxsA family protein [Corynebacterium uberis]|uniref:FxsA family protein n=1 Tax=Corynebacterium TaxID=1716 RepID=UPI001D0A5C5E|nr:FxsA family protein [Corynebacterium uberis]MCZ9308670.1 FxsA family protein [Corynebacterium sp. c6VSa_13]UDL74309.1 FxsA family protein [Corynebacterium uberis]UDL76858.1 FxsA family protein [Corynebacterium uberis]UDL79071.1 FxsA family protein [Corynebacterium uberis]UDL79309.1 FxsA family protein [Corynebacterium uberis]
MPLFIAVPYVLIELLAFIAVAAMIGTGWALLALVVVFFVGLGVAAWQLRRISTQVRQRSIPATQAMGDYGLTAAGALCVAAPGFVSSVLGLVLIIPPTRAMVRRMTARRLRAKVEDFGLRGFQATDAYRRRASYGSFGTHPHPGGTAAGSGSGEIIDSEEISRWSSQVDPEDFGTPDSPRE